MTSTFVTPAEEAVAPGVTCSADIYRDYRNAISGTEDIIYDCKSCLSAVKPDSLKDAVIFHRG